MVVSNLLQNATTWAANNRRQGLQTVGIIASPGRFGGYDVSVFNTGEQIPERFARYLMDSNLTDVPSRIGETNADPKPEGIATIRSYLMKHQWLHPVVETEWDGVLGTKITFTMS